MTRGIVYSICFFLSFLALIALSSSDRDKPVGRSVGGAYYYQQLFTNFLQGPAYKVSIGNLGPPDSMLEKPAEVRPRAIGEGIHVLLVLGFPPLPIHPELPPPCNPPNPIPPAHECPPHWPLNLTSTDLSNIESGDPQDANNNFSS